MGTRWDSRTIRLKNGQLKAHAVVGSSKSLWKMTTIRMLSGPLPISSTSAAEKKTTKVMSCGHRWLPTRETKTTKTTIMVASSGHHLLRKTLTRSGAHRPYHS